MRTKQLRLNDPAQIRQRMPEFIGKQINVVLTDMTVMFGELRTVNGSEIILRNMRLENVKYPFHMIAEVYLDTKV
jgi:hypothetical protein